MKRRVLLRREALRFVETGSISYIECTASANFINNEIYLFMFKKVFVFVVVFLAGGFWSVRFSGCSSTDVQQQPLPIELRGV